LFLKDPGFFAVAIIILALGIGGNTAIFSFVYGTLLAPMPYPRPDQVVVVWSKIHGQHNGVSAGDFLDWRQQSTAFQGMAAFTGQSFNISTGESPEEVEGERVSPGWFSKIFGVGPWLGRDFSPEEGELGKDHVVILSHRLWERRFGSDRNLVGRQIRVDSEPYTVLGVLPSGSYDRLPAELFAPLSFKPEQINHDFHWILVLARLRPGVSLAQAQADMDLVTRRIAEAYPKSNKSWGASVEPLHNDFLDRNVQKALWLMLGAVGLVLLIACANVANLLLARGVAREREVAVRASLGASRGQLFGQFLTESLALAVAGGALGIGIGWILLKVMIVAMPRMLLPSEADVSLNLPVLLFSVLASMLSGVLFGCAPAWHAARANLNEALKEGGRATGGSTRHRLRRALVVVEIALAMTLLTGAGLLIHSFWNFTRVDFGFRKDHVLTFELPVLNDRFSNPDQLIEFYRGILEKIAALPGVEHVSASTGLPLEGTGFGMPFSIAGKPVTDLSSRPGAGFQMVTPDYYQTFGIALDSGRSFTQQDVAGGLPVAMVNENFVKRFLPGVDPLTQRVVVEQLIPGVTRLGPPIEWQVVGVFHNVRYGGSSNREDSAEIDVPFWQIPWPQASIAIRSTVTPESLVKSVAAIVRSIDSDLPLTEVKTMDQLFDESVSSDRFDVTLLGSFAGLALLVATIGIYGVMAFNVAQRTHEIGLRIALGASRNHVLGMILKEGFMLVLAGLGLGLAGAWLVERATQSLLWGIGAVDLPSLIVISAVLWASALLACYFPARRATHVDPMVALRYE
jgi:putative ABC transport system permease protein